MSFGARSPTPPGYGDDRDGSGSGSASGKRDFEQRLAEIELKHQEKVKQVESDYQTAVRYVKGSEKMLKRMKVGLGPRPMTLLLVIVHYFNAKAC